MERIVSGALVLAFMMGCGAPERVDRELSTHLPRHRPAPTEDEPMHRGLRFVDPTPREIARLQYSECEPGETRECFAPGTGPSMQPGAFVMTCRASSSGALVFDRSDCATPLVLAWEGEAVRFTTSDARFEVGPYRATEWVSPRTPWLALDLDGSGCIEGQHELFGADGDARDGFAKLARYDENHDGSIDARDPVFARLVVWRDEDQDKRCTADEIARVADGPVRSIGVRAEPVARGLAGSHEGARAPLVWLDGAGRAHEGRVVDVYLAPIVE